MSEAATRTAPSGEYADRTARLSSAAENATRLATALLPFYGQRSGCEFASASCDDETPPAVAEARQSAVVSACEFLADYYARLRVEMEAR